MNTKDKEQPPYKLAVLRDRDNDLTKEWYISRNNFSASMSWGKIIYQNIWCFFKHYRKQPKQIIRKKIHSDLFIKMYY